MRALPAPLKVIGRASVKHEPPEAELVSVGFISHNLLQVCMSSGLYVHVCTSVLVCLLSCLKVLCAMCMCVCFVASASLKPSEEQGSCFHGIGTALSGCLLWCWAAEPSHFCRVGVGGYRVLLLSCSLQGLRGYFCSEAV